MIEKGAVVTFRVTPGSLDSPRCVHNVELQFLEVNHPILIKLSGCRVFIPNHNAVYPVLFFLDFAEGVFTISVHAQRLNLAPQQMLNEWY